MRCRSCRTITWSKHHGEYSDQPLNHTDAATDFVGRSRLPRSQMLCTPLLKGRAIDAVPVTQEIPRGLVPRKASMTCWAVHSAWDAR